MQIARLSPTPHTLRRSRQAPPIDVHRGRGRRTSVVSRRGRRGTALPFGGLLRRRLEPIREDETHRTRSPCRQRARARPTRRACLPCPLLPSPAKPQKLVSGLFRPHQLCAHRHTVVGYRRVRVHMCMWSLTLITQTTPAARTIIAPARGAVAPSSGFGSAAPASSGRASWPGAGGTGCGWRDRCGRAAAAQSGTCGGGRAGRRRCDGTYLRSWPRCAPRVAERRGEVRGSRCTS